MLEERRLACSLTFLVALLLAPLLVVKADASPIVSATYYTVTFDGVAQGEVPLSSVSVPTLFSETFDSGQFSSSFTWGAAFAVNGLIGMDLYTGRDTTLTFDPGEGGGGSVNASVQLGANFSFNPSDELPAVGDPILIEPQLLSFDLEGVVPVNGEVTVLINWIFRSGSGVPQWGLGEEVTFSDPGAFSYSFLDSQTFEIPRPPPYPWQVTSFLSFHISGSTPGYVGFSSQPVAMAASVPEPTTGALLALGLAALAVRRRRLA